MQNITQHANSYGGLGDIDLECLIAKLKHFVSLYPLRHP